MPGPSPDIGVASADLLAVYCNDHLAASVGGIELAKRVLGEHGEQPLGPRRRRARSSLVSSRTVGRQEWLSGVRRDIAGDLFGGAPR